MVEGLSPTDVKIVEEVLNQKTPVELGFVPPSCKNYTPSNSGDDQDQNRDEGLDVESGVETVEEEDSDEDDPPRVRKLPPNQESRPLSNTHRLVTAAMRKSQYVDDYSEVLRAGLDPREMPKHPDNTPPSPPQRHPRPALPRNPYFVWNPWVQGREPGQHPGKPDSTIPAVTPRAGEEVEADVTNRIRIARRQSDATQFTQVTTPRDSPNQAGCAHFGGRATPQCPFPQPCGPSPAPPAALGIKTKKFTGKRISGPPTVKDRLGIKPQQVDTRNKSSGGAQAPEESSGSEEEQEEDTKEDPAPEDMSHLDLLKEVLRWRNMFRQRTQRRPAEDMSHLDLLREVLRWRNSKKLKKSSGPGDDPEGRQ